MMKSNDLCTVDVQYCIQQFKQPGLKFYDTLEEAQDRILDIKKMPVDELCDAKAGIIEMFNNEFTVEKFAKNYINIISEIAASIFRVLVGLYSCVYVAQKNAKKIAYTSISAAIINIAVDLILINKIQVFAASLSTLIAFLSMFIVRYIDVNKTVHMKIRNKYI